MDDNANYQRGINQFIKSNNKNDLKERIYDYGLGQKFHIFSKDHQKTKEYRAVITSDFGMPDMNQYLKNDKPSNTNQIKQDTNINNRTSRIDIEKSGGVNRKNQSAQKDNYDIENQEKEEKSNKLNQELESITGFKTLSPLPPSRGKVNNFENPLIERYKLSMYKKDNFHTTKTKMASTNMFTLKNLSSKMSTTIINLDERRKTNDLDEQIKNERDKSDPQNDVKKKEEDDQKNGQDEEDKNMDIINKFIREAFEGKDYRTNFVYYLPSGKENYYDLKTADFNDISKEKVYYTLSAKGLTVYVEKKPKEFIKLSEWIIEKQAYNYVSDINFFKNFKIWRILKLWRQNIFRKKKINYCSELKSKLLLSNNNYNHRIYLHKKECNKVLQFKILDLRQGLESISFQNFKENQDKSRAKLSKELNIIHDICEDLFVKGIKSIFSQLQRKINLENNEANYNNEDAKSRFKKFSKPKKEEKKDEDKKFANDDNIISEDNIVGFENLRYKSKNSIKTECMNFIKLAFLFDYIILDVLRKMYLFSMKEILDKISDYNKDPVPKFRENYMNKNGDFSKPQTIVNPNRVVSYLIIKCNLENSRKIEESDKIYKKAEPYNFEHNSDELFDPTIHLNLERNIQVYKPGEKEPDKFKVEVKKLHKTYISFEPDCEKLIQEFILQIGKSLDCLRITGWKGHPEFKRYLAFLEDWDDRFGDWDNKEAKELELIKVLKNDDFFIDPLAKGNKDDKEQSIKLIKDPIVHAYKKCDEFLNQINPYLQSHYQQKSIKKELLLEDDLIEQDEVFRLLFNFTEKNIQTLKRYIPYEEEIGLIKLSMEDRLRKDLIQAQNSIWEYLKPILPDTLRQRLSNIEKWFIDVSNKTSGSIDQVSQYLEKKRAYEILDSNFPIYEEKLMVIEKILSLCKSKGFHITSEDMNNIHSLNGMKIRLKASGEELNELLTRKKEILKNDMFKVDIIALESAVRDTLEKINQDKYLNFEETNKSLIPSILSEIEGYQRKYKEYAEKSRNFNEFLIELNEGEEDFSYVQNLSEGITILKNLWETLQRFDDEIDLWRVTLFKDIKTKEIISKLEGYEIIGKRAKNHFNERGNATLHLLDQLAKFKESMKVIEDLSNPDLDTEQQGLPPGVKEKYWVRVQALFDEKVLKDVVLASKEYKLDFLLQINAYQYQKQINEISREASNNKKLKETLDKIEMKWKEQMIDIKPNPAMHDINTIFKIEDTVAKIEELQVELNNVMASRYVKFFKNKVEDLKNSFENALDYLSDLKSFQKKWMYLSNILSGNEMKKLSQEMSEFQKLDEGWKTFLSKALEAKKILPNIQKSTHCKKFDVKKNIDTLDKIQMKIEDHLKVLRGQFARFYFISNDDLLYILSNGTDLDKIKPYFGKIFEDVSDFRLAPTGNKEITHLISITGEELELGKVVRTQDQIEKWLDLMEESMNNTIRNHINKTNSSDELVMEELIQKNISQVVATKTHQEFCIKFEIAVDELRRDKSAMDIFILRIKERSDELSRIVNRNYTPQKRRIITNLITHYVHNRDMVEKLYLDDDISDINEFAWQQQLRTYYEGSGIDARFVDVVVRQLRSVINYGYEYIGPMPRVVITPLTDRVWLTITASLNIKLGCSLGGPAGTGKTETTKDLAKFFGFQCIVFNCSEQIDYKILGNIFSGLAKHKNGAYTCLDEFNRINVEVLSVVAQQLLNIRLALLSQKPGELVSVTILDKIEMIGKLGIFITMNPTYAGRTELPDNLKSLFRPITMMVPDFQIISKVKLSSEGFKYYDKLAEKLDQLYKLASQQLSQQDHYDFTLRTLGSVLAIAGNLKRLAVDDSLKDEETILIRALRQANIPKFLPDDILMFNALISDLFPGSEVQDQNFDDLREEIKTCLKSKGLENSDFLINKCIQLFDIVTIRLGVCLIGSAGTGKTTCYEILEDAMTNLRKNGHPDPRYKDVKHWTMNPKSVTMGELYGMENEETRAFIFGIMTKKIKKALADEGEHNNRWVVLDGPIDTKWIENLNSVLDDSMTLCLSNGERIKLKTHIKILFEVEDLIHASLATVSRMGIIYMQANELGWRPYVYSWINRFLLDDSVLTNDMKTYLKNLFEDKVDEALDNISDVKDSIYIYPVYIQCVTSICRFLEFFLRRENGFMGKDNPEKDSEATNRMKKKLVSVFGVSVVWGVFGCVSNRGFAKVENFMKIKFTEIKLEVPLIMEHFYEFAKNDFIHWQTKLTQFVYTPGTPYFSIFVHTIDSLRYSYLLEALCSIQKNILVTGETGVGKSSIINNSIKKLLLTEEYSSILMNFSAQTTSEDTQRNLEAKLDKKKGKKLLGGKNGKRVLIFIDDVNMPEPTEFNSHPPIELIRQYLDFGEIYDRQKYFLKKIEDVSMIIAGGPPIGGRSKLTTRFTRHYTQLCIPQAGKEILISIFENILKGFTSEERFSDEVKKLSLDVTLSTIDIYEIVCKTMKPIPAKFHYSFNLRDVSKVFQGLLMVKNKSVKNGITFAKLWVHEVLRIFGDRMINNEDLKNLQDNVVFLVKNKLKCNDLSNDNLFKVPVYFGQIHKGDLKDGVEKLYEEIGGSDEDRNLLRKKLSYYLEIYNKNYKKNQLNLVFFDYAINHIIRITRVLRQPRGNIVLIGQGGTGKQTLTKFSSFIMESIYGTFVPTKDYKLQTFRKDIKDYIINAGIYQKRVSLVLTDNNVTHNFILEDINSLLNNGEISNLLDSADFNKLNDLSEYVKKKGLPESRDILYENFIELTRENLHIIFCTSPVGDTLRIRCRKFPALINCCALNWFMSWPQEALISCCSNSFKELSLDQNIKKSLVDMSTQVQLDVEALTERFMMEVSRRIYVTPKSFLDMINLFLNLLKKKKGDFESNRKKLFDGVKKLDYTSDYIVKLEAYIQKLEPEIIKQQVEANESNEEIKIKKKENEEKEKVLKDKSGYIDAKTHEAEIILRNAEKKKTTLDSELKESWKEVEENVNSESIANMLGKKVENNQGFISLYEAVALVTSGNKVKGFTEAKNVLVSQMRELPGRIKKFKDEISGKMVKDSVMELFKVYIYSTIPNHFVGAEFTGDSEVLENTIADIRKRNRTLGGIFIWGTAIIKYWELEKEIAPIKDQIEKLNEEVKGLKEQYDGLNNEYMKTLNETKALMHKNEELTKKIKDFEEEIRINNERKKNAKDLTRLLKDEGIRWKETLSVIDKELDNFLGNIFLSSAIISYLSPFTGSYRKEQVNEWIKLCSKYNVKVSPDYNLETTISDQVEIRSWNINGLPSDTVSKENAIMLFNNPKFALLIDPQVQANTWLKKMFKQDKNDKNADYIRIYKGDKTEKQGEKTDKNDDIALKLTADIQRGSNVLIENVGIRLDTLFNPLMLRTQYEENGAYYIEFNNNPIEYHPSFCIYFTTKLANPHYPPEYFINLNIINFTVTFQGLSEQLLSEVFRYEKREKYEERDKLVEEMGECNAEIKNLERIILERLAEAKQEAILDDKELIETLERSKTTSEEINIKVKTNKVIEEEIDKLRNDYIPVAVRGSILYFVIVDISNIDPMYQFSLEFFKKLFIKSIEKKRKRVANSVEERVSILESKITKDIFKNIKRGIFENHKTIFSFLIAIYIKKTANVIKEEDWNFFLKGPPTFDKNELLSNPDKSYFTDSQWDSILYFEMLYHYEGFSTKITENIQFYKDFFIKLNSLDQFDEFTQTCGYLVPNNFFKLILIKMFRPEQLLLFVKYFIIAELGKIFTDNTPPKLDEVFAESDYKTPIIFILSQGADPADNLIQFKNRCLLPYEEKKDDEVLVNHRKPNSILISLGQGQNLLAEEAIENSVISGDWVILQNCHLYKSWMTVLGEKVQKIKDDEYPDPIHPNFRLWLTSMPNEFFPISVLQNGLKITTEPPSGVKANVKNLFDNFTAKFENKDDVLTRSKIKEKFPKLAFSLSFFHAVMQERKKFGPIGFNLRYDFNLTDYDTSYTMMLTYVDENEDDVPWKSITYLVGDVNYGGRVTDDWDRRTMKTTLKKFLTEKLFDDRYKFTPDGTYYCPYFLNLNKYIEYVDSLPLSDDPEFFGLHSNANIIFQLQESNNLVNTLLKIVPKTKSTGKSPNEVILETIKFFSENKPDLLERKERAKIHDKIYENGLNHSLTIVMYQELDKFNKILIKIQSSLENLEDAIKGTITMSNEGDEIFNSLLINKIPLAWSKICYPSHKPLASWFNDLLQRVQFIRGWLTQGHPPVFWLSGLFYPQGFITGVLQNHARDNKKPVSEISFRYKIITTTLEEIKKGPITGVYINGLFLEGASWDYQNSLLIDQIPGEMNCKMPIIWFETVMKSEIPDEELEEDDDNEEEDDEEEEAPQLKYYKCPLFKTLKRTGIISSSGRSDNFVRVIVLPSKLKKSFFVLRGTALICQLDD